jgi:hypothetical protein
MRIHVANERLVALIANGIARCRNHFFLPKKAQPS